MVIPSPDSRLPETGSRWHAIAAEQTLFQLDTSTSLGLSTKVAETRQVEYGPNAFPSQARQTWQQVLIRQFMDVLIGVLLIAAAISLVVGDITDAITILAIVILNAALGFIQEWKAERALEALQQMLHPQCRVLRDGAERQIDSRFLVPGDITILETGDHVPADLRLIEALNLQVDESALTGESAAILKQSQPVAEQTDLADQRCMAWMGTAVTNGRAIGVVVDTGAATEFGRIAALTESISDETTPLQLKLRTLGKQLGLVALGVSIIVAATGLWSGRHPLEMFLTSVSLAVAIVPEGLPAVVTLTMALGIRAMVRRKALLRRLQAAEGLGAATVICTDKTGTLTKNEMTVQRIWLPSGFVDVSGIGYAPIGTFNINHHEITCDQHPDLIRLLRTALHCNHATLHQVDKHWQPLGEPTEAALVVAAGKASLTRDHQRRAVTEFSFNSNRKRMTVVEAERDGKFLALCKGAPEVILERSTQWMEGDTTRQMTAEDQARVQQVCQQLAADGLRTLAIAERHLPSQTDCWQEDSVERELTLLGIVGMLDPPRAEVPAAIELTRTAGVQVIMITGDAAATATAIAKSIGLRPQRTIEGSELNVTSDGDLLQALQGEVVFARTTPEHKMRIVGLLQSQKHVVAMTGDGVNDAPALKKADVGIAMGKRGTDVAKGASDIVLTDDNFSSIVGAIEEGRRQYDNIKKFVRYLLSSNMGEVTAIFLNIIFGGPLILLPVQILWMNLVTDGLTAVALGVEPAEPSVMTRPPREPSKAVLDIAGIGMILALGTYIGIVALWIFQHYLSSGDPQSHLLAQTTAFTAIIMIEKMNVLNFRSTQTPLSKLGWFTNPWVLIAIAATIALQIAAVYTPVLQHALHTVPLRIADWCLIIAVAFPIFIVPEAIKYAFHRNSVPNATFRV